jgi:hypothetical protein
MGIREQIMALPCPYHNASNEWYAWELGVEQAADIAEARERELQERMAQMIAELRGLVQYDRSAHEYYPITAENILAVLDEYR